MNCHIFPRVWTPSCLFLTMLVCGLPVLGAEPVRKEARWEQVPNNGGYIVEIKSVASGVRLIKQYVTRPPLVFSVEPGMYRLRIITLNRWGQPESSSDWVNFNTDMPAPIVQFQGPTALATTRNFKDDGVVIVPLPERKGLSPFEKNLRHYFYSEVFLLNRPFETWGTGRIGGKQNHSPDILFDDDLPSYFLMLRYRIGVKGIAEGIGLDGFSFGLQSEILPLHSQLSLYHRLQTYNIPSSSLHSVDLTYKLPLADRCNLVATFFPVAFLYRTLGIRYGGNNNIDFFAPMNYTAGSEDIEVAIPISVKNFRNFFELYLPIIDHFFGGRISLQYNAGKNLVLNTSAYFWASYSQTKIVDWALETTIGIRF